MSKYKSYSVKVSDHDLACREADKLNIKKYAFLGTLLRAWKILTPEQRSQAIEGRSRQREQSPTTSAA